VPVAFFNVVIVNKYWQLFVSAANANARPAWMAWYPWSTAKGEGGWRGQKVGPSSGGGWVFSSVVSFPKALCWSTPRTLPPDTQLPILTSLSITEST
jgi:hypothetical protein